MGHTRNGFRKQVTEANEGPLQLVGSRVRRMCLWGWRREGERQLGALGGRAHWVLGPKSC